MKEQPKVVALVGSSRFKKLFHEEGFRLEKQGITVLMMGCFQHADNLSMSPEEFERVHSTDLVRINLADSVLVLNCKRGHCTGCGKWFVYPDEGICDCGAFVRSEPYVGESTRREIEYATAAGKVVRYLNPPEG